MLMDRSPRRSPEKSSRGVRIGTWLRELLLQSQRSRSSLVDGLNGAFTRKGDEGCAIVGFPEPTLVLHERSFCNCG